MAIKNRYVDLIDEYMPRIVALMTPHELKKLRDKVSCVSASHASVTVCDLDVLWEVFNAVIEMREQM